MPVVNIKKSVQWYSETFGYDVIWEDDNMANLKLVHGPLLFLKKTAEAGPIHFTFEGADHPVISFKTSDIEAFHHELKARNVEVGPINDYGMGSNGPYRDFEIRDPDGHLIEVNSFPDLSLPRYRGY